MRLGNLRLALAGLGVAGAAAVLAGAGAFSVFSTTSTNISSFATGSLAITNTPSCATYDGGTGTTGNSTSCSSTAVLQGTNLVPGDQLSGSAAITNSGGVRASYNLGGSTSETDSNNLQGSLLLAVYEQKPGDATACALTWTAGSADGTSAASITPNSHCAAIYNGTWSGFNGSSNNAQNDSGTAGGAWLHNEAHTFYVMAGLPLSAGNSLQGSSASATLTWTATSVASH
jgi:hypothetical protein